MNRFSLLFLFLSSVAFVCADQLEENVHVIVGSIISIPPGKDVPITTNVIVPPEKDVPIHSNVILPPGKDVPIHSNTNPFPPGQGVPIHTNSISHPKKAIQIHTDSISHPKKAIQFHINTFSPPDKDVPIHTNTFSHAKKAIQIHTNTFSPPDKDVPIHTNTFSPPDKDVPIHTNTFSPPDKDVPIHTNTMSLPDDNELYDTIYQQKMLIESLESQIQALTVTEASLSTLAANVRSSCQADFQSFCSQNQLLVDPNLVYATEIFDYSDYSPYFDTLKPDEPIPEDIPNDGQFDNNHASHDHSKDSHDSHDSHDHSKDSHDSHDHGHNHGHDHHAEHHGHRKQFKFRNLRSLHSQENGQQPPHRLGFGSFDNDQCMMSHIMELSINCQTAINQKIESNELNMNQNNAIVYDDDNKGCHGGLVATLLIVFIVFTCAVRRHRKRFLKMKKFIDVLYDNAEIKSVVEGIVGEPLPSRCQPCGNKSKKCFILKRVFAVWFFSSIIVALFYLAFGTPIEIVLIGILSSLFQLIVLIIVVSIVIKIFKCCFKCFCKRNNSNNETSSNKETSEYPGQNRLLIQPIIFNPNSIPFQYQPIPTNHSINEHAPYNSSNENIEMAYAGIPIQPNNL
jgi:hypothetical protein